MAQNTSWLPSFEIPNLMKTIILAFCYLALFVCVNAQHTTVIIVDEQGEALSGALIDYHGDDDKVKTSITDFDGKLLIEIGASKTINLQVSYLGYENLDTTLVLASVGNIIQLTLTESAQMISELTIKGSRPLMVQKGDKIILDPTPLLDMSTNTLELLETTPGLFVDQDGGIYMGNMTPAAIWINGREQRMSQQDISNLLRSLPPGSIQYIELIKNPSAKYDAASSGGIINIVLKIGIQLGMFGSINASYNQGRRGSQQVGFNLNKSGGNQSFYISTNLSTDGALHDMNSERSNQAPFILLQNAQNDRRAYNFLQRFGYSKDLSDRLNIAYDGRVSFFRQDINNFNSNIILNKDRIWLGETTQQLKSMSPSFNHTHDLGATFKLDSIGSNIHLKMSFSQSDYETRQVFEDAFIGSIIDPRSGEGMIQNNRHFFQSQLDYTHYFTKEITVETGIKYSYLGFDNSTHFVQSKDGENIPDPQRNSEYEYRERITAAYIEGYIPLMWKLGFKAGIRVEQTDMNGEQVVPQDTGFRVQRLDWFPYLFVSRPLMKIAGFSIKSFAIYRKTLNRPGYQQLNPAFRLLDQFNYEIGNPNLNPQFTDNLEFNISLDDYPIFAIGQNTTRGIITQVLYPDPIQPELTFNTFENIGRSRETYVRVVGGIPPGKMYFGMLGAQYNWMEYEGLYLNMPIVFNQGSWRIFTFHSLKLGKKTKFNTYAFMLINGQMNLLKLGHFGQVNFSLNQSLLKDKMNLSIFLRDAFKTMVTPFALAQGGIEFSGDRYADNQRIGIQLRYQFGWQSPQQKTKRNPLDQFEEN